MVIGGDAKIDNRKYKDQFGGKASLLAPDEVVRWTGQPIGDVCPFGLPQELRIFADLALKKFDVVIPAPGATTRRFGSPLNAWCNLSRLSG